MNLIDIINQQAEFTCDSGVAVETDSRLGMVNIYEVNNPDCCVFLQGDEGYDWIAETAELWEQVQYLDMETVELAQAYPYLDVLAETP